MTETLKTTPQVAIVGTEGSGKTILATVWAKRMTQRQDEIFLDPKGFNTGMYVERAWATLSRGEWCESTPPGTKFELEWDLLIGKNAYPVKLVDVAGQDLRNLFSHERHKDQNNLSDNERDILDYVVKSSLVVFVVNLQDFVGEPNATKRLENEFILKAIMDKFIDDEKSPEIIIAFTAYDLYKAEITNKHGTLDQYIEKEFIYLFHSLKKWANKFNGNNNISQLFLPVAAVSETKIAMGNNTPPRRVPKPNFTSFGIDKFSDWIIEKIKKLAVQGTKKQKYKTAKLKQQKWKKQLLKIASMFLYGIPATVISLFMWGFLRTWGNLRTLDSMNDLTYNWSFLFSFCWLIGGICSMGYSAFIAYIYDNAIRRESIIYPTYNINVALLYCIIGGACGVFIGCILGGVIFMIYGHIDVFFDILFSVILGMIFGTIVHRARCKVNSLPNKDQ